MTALTWQRVEGGNTDLSTGVQGQLAVSLTVVLELLMLLLLASNLGLVIGTDVAATDCIDLKVCCYRL